MSSVAGSATGIVERPHQRPGASAIDALRGATASAHDQVDRSMPLSRQPPSVGAYVAHLEIIRAWLRPIDDWLRRFSDGPQDVAWLPPLPRLSMIDADLAELRPAMGSSARATDRPADRATGSAPGTVAGASADRPVPAAWDAAPAFRWGVCYVIEGSGLGGLVLGRRIADLAPGHRPRFLSVDREAVGARWQQFRKGLQANVHEPADVERACTGARAAFDELVIRIRPHAEPFTGRTHP